MPSLLKKEPLGINCDIISANSEQDISNAGIINNAFLRIDFFLHKLFSICNNVDSVIQQLNLPFTLFVPI